MPAPQQHITDSGRWARTTVMGKQGNSRYSGEESGHLIPRNQVNHTERIEDQGLHSMEQEMGGHPEKVSPA